MIVAPVLAGILRDAMKRQYAEFFEHSLRSKSRWSESAASWIKGVRLSDSSRLPQEEIVSQSIPGSESTSSSPRSAATPIRDAIRSNYRQSMWALVLRGLLGLAIGILVFARPLDSVAAFALVIALWALFDGIANIARAFAVRNVVPHWWVLLLAGIVSVVFGGAALYYYPALSLSFAVVWTGWWLLTAGVLAVYVAMQERKLAVPWGWTMFIGLLSIVAGILAFIYPGVTLASLMGLIAAFAIVVGVMMLVAAWKLHSAVDDVRQSVGQI
jgi:uncharacterized membrane protein HdeD (DUF308 family)